MFLTFLWLRFVNNVLSTAQQVWLRKLGGAKPVVGQDAGGIISAGQAKRTASQPIQTGERQLKEEENRRKLNKSLPAEELEVLASVSDSDDVSDDESKEAIDRGSTWANKVNIFLLAWASYQFDAWVQMQPWPADSTVKNSTAPCQTDENEELERAHASSNTKQLPDYSRPRRSKRSKRKRAA
ncbi:hypothetical protein ACLOJK_012916 [Asimina triloba]